VYGVMECDGIERVHATVTAHRGAEQVSEQELKAYAAQGLAQYMVPRTIKYIEEMPRKGAGKIDRDRLRMRDETGMEDL